MTKNEIKELYKKKYRRDTTTVRVPPAVYDYLTTYASHMQVTIRTAIVHAYNEFAHVCKTDDGAARDSLYKIVGGRNVGTCKNIAVPNNVYCVLRDLQTNSTPRKETFSQSSPYTLTYQKMPSRANASSVKYSDGIERWTYHDT